MGGGEAQRGAAGVIGTEALRGFRQGWAVSSEAARKAARRAAVSAGRSRVGRWPQRVQDAELGVGQGVGEGLADLDGDQGVVGAPQDQGGHREAGEAGAGVAADGEGGGLGGADGGADAAGHGGEGGGGVGVIGMGDAGGQHVEDGVGRLGEGGREVGAAVRGGCRVAAHEAEGADAVRRGCRDLQGEVAAVAGADEDEGGGGAGEDVGRALLQRRPWGQEDFGGDPVGKAGDHLVVEALVAEQGRDEDGGGRFSLHGCILGAEHQVPQQGKKDGGGEGVEAHGQAAEGAGSRVHGQGAGGADAVADGADGQAAGAPVGDPAEGEHARTEEAPTMPEQMTTAAVSEGRPPRRSATPMATGVVTDLGAREAATSGAAPNRRARATPEAAENRPPPTIETITARKECRTTRHCR